MPVENVWEIVNYIHVPILEDVELVARDFYKNKMGFFGDYSEFSMDEAGLIRLQLKYNENVERINLMGASSLCSIYLSGDFLERCKAWKDNGVNIELLQLDPGGFTAVVCDPLMNRLEFRGSESANHSAIDPSEWSFFRAY